jgi:hypothetical protein
MNQRFMMLSSIQPDELSFLENLTEQLTEEQKNLFITMYSSKRKTSDTILICTLLAFVGIAGVQRFITGQIGMGLLYLFTAGLCLVGTIVDIINHKEMA